MARVAQVIVPDYQLSLAIGKEGQNARLAHRLTGWKIDIRPDTQVAAPPGREHRAGAGAVELKAAGGPEGMSPRRGKLMPGMARRSLPTLPVPWPGRVSGAGLARPSPILLRVVQQRRLRRP